MKEMYVFQYVFLNRFTSYNLNFERSTKKLCPILLGDVEFVLFNSKLHADI